jgi:hypothetical protein
MSVLINYQNDFRATMKIHPDKKTLSPTLNNKKFRKQKSSWA